MIKVNRKLIEKLPFLILLVTVSFLLFSHYGLGKRFQTVFEEARQWQIAADDPGSDRKIEQQINIIDQEIISGGTDKGIVLISTANYTGATYYFEVIAKVSSGSGSAELTYNADSGSLPSGGSTTTISDITATSYTRYRSSSFSPTGSQNAYISSLSGTGISVLVTRIIIVQSDSSLITDTQTQIEVGNNENTASISYVDLTDKKIYYFDSSKFDPAPTAYFEASFKASATAGTPTDLTLRPDAAGDETNWTPDSGSNYARVNEADADDDTSYVERPNTAAANDLYNIDDDSGAFNGATIQSVTVNVRGRYVHAGTKGSTPGDPVLNILVKPSGGSVNQQGTHSLAATYGNFSNTWSNNPYTGSAWTQSEINSLQVGIRSARTVGNQNRTHTPRVTQVYVVVDYTPPGASGTAYAALYTVGGSLIADSEVSTSSFSWVRIRSGPITLTNDTEYVLRAKTSDSATPAYIGSAKIILDQSSVDGVDAVEMVHQYVNTKVSESAGSWTGQKFYNLYNTNNFKAGLFDYFFEATLKNNSGNAAARLTPGVLGQVGGNYADYTRHRSASISPADDTGYDTEIQYADVSSSWLVVQATGLTVLYPRLEQNEYRWRNDSTALNTDDGWLAATNTSVVIMKETTTRLRFEIANTGDGAATDTEYLLEYATSTGGPWTAVPTTTGSDAFVMATSSKYTDKDSITQSFLTPTGDFTNGTAVAHPSNKTSPFNLATSTYSEFEYAIQATDNATSSQTYYFRLTNEGATTDFTYLAYPEINIGWWNHSWLHRKKLTFDNSGQSENLTDFPLLVKLTTSNFNYDNAKSDGTDLRFIDSDDSTELKYHIEKWDSLGDSFVWVKVPQIDGSSNTDYIFMYYGNAGAVNVQNSTSTFSSNYAAVYHMNEPYWDGTAEEVKDSTEYGNHGKAVGDADTTSEGQVDGAGAFDGAGDYVEVNDSASLEVTNLTINAWVNSTNFTPSDFLRNDNRMVVSKVDREQGYQLGLTNENKPYFAFENFSVNLISKYNNIVPTNSDTTSTDGRIPLGTSGKGDSSRIHRFSVIKDGSTYKMWYTGHDGSNWRIYHATSTDGLTWTKVNNNVPTNSDTTSTDGRIPLGTSGKGDSAGVEHPTVIKDGSTYKMWYDGYDGSNWRVYHATSPDGLTWTKVNNTIPTNSDTASTDGRIPLGTTGKGDATHIQGPSVIKDGSTYKMWYHGYDTRYRIYLATSSDGLTWTKVNNNAPANSDTTSTDGRIPLGTTGKGDVYHSYYASVIKDGSMYRMWYAGMDGSNQRIYHATSPDGLTWTKYNNIIPTDSDTTSTDGRIPLGNTSGRGDFGQVTAPGVIKDGSTYKIWYLGSVSSGSERIYYATLETGVTSSTAVPSEFTMLTGVADTSADTIKLYVNGSLDVSGTTSVNGVNNSEKLRIGELVNGKIDEVRISAVPRSADWISAKYLSMTCQFTTLVEQKAPVSIDEITISGTVYTDEAKTSPYDCSANNLVIGVSVNGGVTATTTCTLDSGAYSINVDPPESAGDPVVVFIDSTETPKATTATLVADTGSNIENLHLFIDRVLITHESVGPMTNAKLTTGDNDDAGIRYSTSFGNLTIESGLKLLVHEGKTFTPGGTVTTPVSANSTLPGGDLEIQTGAELNMSHHALSVGGNYLNSGTFSGDWQTTTFTATAAGHTIKDGGNAFYDIVFNGSGGEWLYQDGAVSAPNSVTVQAGTPTFLNAKTGTVDVQGGTLNVDWYLGIHVVAKNSTSTDINTDTNDITVTEATASSTVFRHNGSGWGTASSNQLTDTDLTGINPQPNNAGAIRIREYTKTAVATTTHQYNLQIAVQTGYVAYDYFTDHGGNYLTSSLALSGDNTISDGWYRATAGTVNGTKDYSGLNEPPTQGTWYVGMASDLVFSVDKSDADLSPLNQFNLWTNTASTTLSVQTSFSDGYIVKSYASNNGELRLDPGNTIQRWSHNNDNPALWNNTCDGPEEECGFGHTTNDTTLGSICNDNRFDSGNRYAGFATSLETAAEVARSCVAVPSGEDTIITYRVSAPRLSVPGEYGVTIFYIASVNY